MSKQQEKTLSLSRDRVFQFSHESFCPPTNLNLTTPELLNIAISNIKKYCKEGVIYIKPSLIGYPCTILFHKDPNNCKVYDNLGNRLYFNKNYDNVIYRLFNKLISAVDWSQCDFFLCSGVITPARIINALDFSILPSITKYLICLETSVFIIYIDNVGYMQTLHEIQQSELYDDYLWNRYDDVLTYEAKHNAKVFEQVRYKLINHKLYNRSDELGYKKNTNTGKASAEFRPECIHYIIKDDEIQIKTSRELLLKDSQYELNCDTCFIYNVDRPVDEIVNMAVNYMKIIYDMDSVDGLDIYNQYNYSTSVSTKVRIPPYTQYYKGIKGFNDAKKLDRYNQLFNIQNLASNLSRNIMTRITDPKIYMFNDQKVLDDMSNLLAHNAFLMQQKIWV